MPLKHAYTSISIKLFFQVVGQTQQLMKEIVEEHKQSYDENNMRDFIDVYLREMKDGEAPEFTGKNTELGLGDDQ